MKIFNWSGYGICWIFVALAVFNGCRYKLALNNREGNDESQKCYTSLAIDNRLENDFFDYLASLNSYDTCITELWLQSWSKADLMNSTRIKNLEKLSRLASLRIDFYTDSLSLIDMKSNNKILYFS